MSRETVAFDQAYADYVRELAVLREDDVLADLRRTTAELPNANMQIAVEQGRFMAALVRMIGARRCIEVGTFTGYSALCVAQALPVDGKLVACDVSAEYTARARPYWERAGVADRIDLRIGPASDTLQAMIDAGEASEYDFAFIDADKESYPDYYEKCLRLLRSGGVLAIDNIFMHGRALEPDATHPGAVAIHTTTRKAYEDARVEPTLIPIGDGVLLARNH